PWVKHTAKCHVQEQVAEVSHHGSGFPQRHPKTHLSAHIAQPFGHRRHGVRDNLHGNSETFTETGTQLCMIDDDDNDGGSVGNDLLHEERAAAALDHVACGIHLVGAVDDEVQCGFQ